MTAEACYVACLATFVVNTAAGLSTRLPKTAGTEEWQERCERRVAWELALLPRLLNLYQKDV